MARMNDVGFQITRDPADAWPDFVGWRVNYEQAAYQIAEAIDAVPALWSGPRHHAVTPIRADPAAPRPAARLDSPEHVNDLSLIPWLCWRA